MQGFSRSCCLPADRKKKTKKIFAAAVLAQTVSTTGDICLSAQVSFQASLWKVMALVTFLKKQRMGWTEGDRKCLSARMISRTSRGRHYADCHLCSKVQARERGGPGCSGRSKMNRFNTVPPLLSPSLSCLFSPPCLPPLSLPSLFSLSLSSHL